MTIDKVEPSETLVEFFFLIFHLMIGVCTGASISPFLGSCFQHNFFFHIQNLKSGPLVKGGVNPPLHTPYVGDTRKVVIAFFDQHLIILIQQGSCNDKRGCSDSKHRLFPTLNCRFE